MSTFIRYSFSPVREIAPADFWEAKYNQEPLQYTSREAEHYASRGIWKLLKPYLKPNERYLDAGCGIGGWLLFLRDQGFDVAGCDITPQTIDRLKAFDSSLDVTVGSLDQLPYPNQSFNGLLAIGVLEYMENRVSVSLQEMSRVIQPQGLLFLEVPLLNPLRRLAYVPLKRLENTWRRWSGRQPIFVHYFFSRSELEKLLTHHGFKILAVAPHELPEPDRHYGLYNDWPFLRGKKPKQLNFLGRLAKLVCNAISPWFAATGILIVARKIK